MRRNTIRTCLAGAASALVFAGSLGTGVAAANEGEPVGGPSAESGVSTFHDARPAFYEPRYTPNMPANGHLVRYKVYEGICWTEGEHQDDGNFAHNKWVLVAGQEAPFTEEPGYVWGGNLEGTDTGNVANQC